MSHFAVLVIGDDVEAQLAPFHEFESTGRDDEYVIDVDVTEEKRAAYESGTATRYIDNAGKLHDPYQDQFYREPTAAELEKHGHRGKLMAGTGFNGDFSYTSRDWGDGRGYRGKVHFVPEGWVKARVPYPELFTFLEYLRDHDDIAVLQHGQKRGEKHKYSFVQLDAKGEVEAVFRHTNADKRVWLDVESGQALFASYGDENLPGLSGGEGRGGELLLDQSGWVVHLLQAMHKAAQQEPTNNRTAEKVAHKSHLWPFPGRVLRDVEFAKRVVQNLQPNFGVWYGQVCGRPLPFDGDSEGDLVYALQHAARSCEGRRILVAESGSVSGKVRCSDSGDKWDYYTIGGRWAGFLKLKPGGKGTSHRRRGNFSMDLGESPAGYADVARKGDVDFEQMRNDKGVKARALWKRCREITGGQSWESWDDTLIRCKTGENAKGEPIIDIERAREEYNGQPAIELLKASKLDEFSWNIDDDLALEEETYVQRERDGACCLFAFLRDGQWTERGQMGWFATVGGEMSMPQWRSRFNAMLDALPDDTLLTVVDCHV